MGTRRGRSFFPLKKDVEFRFTEIVGTQGDQIEFATASRAAQVLRWAG